MLGRIVFFLGFLLHTSASLGAITNFDGTFKIDIPGADAVLHFSFIEMSEQIITVGARTQT